MATLELYCRRWGHDDHYTIDRNAQGWVVSHATHRGQCNKRGDPVLYASMGHDSINWPQALPDYLEFLWEEDQAGNVADLQAALDLLAAWISVTERSSPGDLFLQFK